MKTTINCPVKRPKIMIISGDEAARQSLDSSLQSSVLEPWVIAGDWQELDEVAELEPDLLVLDNRTYYKDILKTLHDLRWKHQIPLLVLGRDGWQMVDALDAGADFYLTIPFSAQMLCARIEVLLRRSHMAKGTYEKMNFDCCANCEYRLDNVGKGIVATEEKDEYGKGVNWSKMVTLFSR